MDPDPANGSFILPPKFQYGTRATYDICGHNDVPSTDCVLVVGEKLSRIIADDAVIG